MEVFPSRHSDEAAPSPAVLIFPGGGYGFLSMEKEGYTPARFFSAHGFTSFVLWYRHSPYRHPLPFCDAGEAILQLRKEHKKWNIDPARIGCLGFSAGGHLATTLATHYKDASMDDEHHTGDKDSLAHMGARPDFLLLLYPVISMREHEYAHMGSVYALLGENPSPAYTEYLSTHTQVTADTPPALLEHGARDNGVPIENSYMFRDALQSHDVPVQLYVENEKEHGYGFSETTGTRCIQWVKKIGIL